jgi:hypothetical protein
MPRRRMILARKRSEITIMFEIVGNASYRNNYKAIDNVTWSCCICIALINLNIYSFNMH